MSSLMPNVQTVEVVRCLQAEAQVDSGWDDEPAEPSLIQQLRAVDVFCRICQNHSFESGYEAARKIEKDLQLEVANCMKKIPVDKWCS